MNIDNKDYFISLLDKNYTNEQLAAHFNCSVTTVKRRKQSFGLIGYKTNKKPLSLKDITAINQLCDSGKSLQEICKITGFSDYLIKKYTSEELYTRIIVNSRNVFASNLVKADISNIFNPTEEAAYICGVLQSDGFITSDNYIGLTAKDKDFVAHFARFFKTGVREVVNKEGKTYYGCRFKDIKNVDKFKQITGIYPQKTYSNYEIPVWIKTNDVFMFYFIAGVFNGDGYIYKLKDRDNVCEIGIEQHFYSREFLKEINRYLGWNHYTNAPNTSLISTKKKDAIKTFFEWYSQIEYAMFRKVSILETLYV